MLACLGEYILLLAGGISACLKYTEKRPLKMLLSVESPCVCPSDPELAKLVRWWLYNDSRGQSKASFLSLKPTLIFISARW